MQRTRGGAADRRTLDGERGHDATFDAQSRTVRLVPSLASLVGQTLRLQSVWGPTGAGIDLTNGVTWRFGR